MRTIQPAIVLGTALAMSAGGLYVGTRKDSEGTPAVKLVTAAAGTLIAAGFATYHVAQAVRAARLLAAPDSGSVVQLKRALSEHRISASLAAGAGVGAIVAGVSSFATHRGDPRLVW